MNCNHKFTNVNKTTTACGAPRSDLLPVVVPPPSPTRMSGAGSTAGQLCVLGGLLFQSPLPQNVPNRMAAKCGKKNK